MRKIIIPKNILEEMHLKEKLPALEISKRLNISENTILRSIRNYHIPFTRYRIRRRRNGPIVKRIYVKCSFCGRVIEKKEEEIQLKKHIFCNSKCQRSFQKKYPHEYRDCSCKESFETMSRRAVSMWNDPEYRKKQTAAHKGVKQSKKSREKRSKVLRELFSDSSFKEKHLRGVRSKQSRKKLSQSMKGRIPWNKGLRKPESERKKIEALQRVSRPEWIKLAKKIRKRDSYTCQECGKNPAFQVHHMVPWKLKKNDLPSNLITLCRSCHKKTDDWNEFLLNLGSNPSDLENFWRKTSLRDLGKRKNYLLGLDNDGIKKLRKSY